METNDELSWKEECEENRKELLSVNEHAYALVRCLRPASGDEVIPGAYGCSEWLMLAAGLQEISVITNGLDVQDTYCSNVAEVERGRVASASAAELTRMLFVWSALDLALKECSSPAIQANTISDRLRNLMDSDIPDLLHHGCAMRTMCKILDSGLNTIPEDILPRASKNAKTDAGCATLCAYYVRNTLAHGSLQWPIDVYGGAIAHVALGRVATRLLLFAIQVYLLSAGDLSARSYSWFDEAEDDWEALSHILPKAHLRFGGIE